MKVFHLRTQKNPIYHHFKRKKKKKKEKEKRKKPLKTRDNRNHKPLLNPRM